MTVSFNGLGNEGRLGNQMFQYAFIRGMSKRYGYDFIIPDANANRFDNYGLFDCFELEGCKTGEGSYLTLECRDTAFNQKFLDECTDNTNYSGVFQTEKYFANATEEPGTECKVLSRRCQHRGALWRLSRLFAPICNHESLCSARSLCCPILQTQS